MMCDENERGGSKSTAASSHDQASHCDSEVVITIVALSYNRVPTRWASRVKESQRTVGRCEMSRNHNGSD
jgi:hypothetical protein